MMNPDREAVKRGSLHNGLLLRVGTMTSLDSEVWTVIPLMQPI